MNYVAGLDWGSEERAACVIDQPGETVAQFEATPATTPHFAPLDRAQHEETVGLWRQCRSFLVTTPYGIAINRCHTPGWPRL